MGNPRHLSQSVSVTYDDNVTEFIVTRVEGNTLVIETMGSFRRNPACAMNTSRERS